MEITTKDEIREWLKQGKIRGMNYMLVKKDWFSYEYYPSYSLTLEDAKKAVSESYDRDADRVIEVYDLSQNWEEQLNEHPCWRI